MLYYVTEYCEKINPVLGRNFNKQKKDPRIDNRLGEFQLKEEYRENNLNSAELSEFLKARGIQRYEYETCVQKIKIPSGIHSLHFPFYQMMQRVLIFNVLGKILWIAVHNIATKYVSCIQKI